MPLYVRQCASCGNTQEALEPVSAQEVIDCPACQVKAFAKQATRAEFIMKGSSFRNGYE